MSFYNIEIHIAINAGLLAFFRLVGVLFIIKFPFLSGNLVGKASIGIIAPSRSLHTVVIIFLVIKILPMEAIDLAVQKTQLLKAIMQQNSISIALYNISNYTTKYCNLLFYSKNLFSNAA